MRSTLFFFLRSSVHCLNSLQQSTLIAVVRHLKFIDFIQLALRTNQKIKYGTSNAFSHQYLFCHNTVFNISIFFFHKPLLNATYNSQYFIAILAFDVFSHFSHCCQHSYWRERMLYPSTTKTRQEKRKERKTSAETDFTSQMTYAFQLSGGFCGYSAHSNLWRTWYIQMCTPPNVTLFVFFDAPALFSRYINIACISLLFIARRIPSTNNNLLTITPI